MDDAERIVVPLDSTGVSLERFGGKGRSLARLAAAGFPVPTGFLVSTTAYEDFVEANQLQSSIMQHVGEAVSGQAAALQAAADAIGALFAEAHLPIETVQAIGQAYEQLDVNLPAVAVRSSATAEDLPDLSFAGQQDTYLNVRGEEALLTAVRKCWSSLWTARAIGYRLQMDIEQRSVAMGVVVQTMVDADVAGILFTANPSNGHRTELVVNASYGLGESIVSGQVTPDTYILNGNSLETQDCQLSDKPQMVVSDLDQGVVTRSVPADKRNEPALPPDKLRELAQICLRVQSLFDDQPQDIEWAIANNQVWLLQSRPITQLPPPALSNVTWDPPEPGGKLVRRQVVEHMPEPLTPLFEDLYLHIGLENAIDQFLVDFGMPLDLESFVQRPFFVTVNGYAYCRGNYRASWRFVRLLPSICCAYLKVVPKLLKNLRTMWREQALPAYLTTIERWKLDDVDHVPSQRLLEGVRELAIADANYWFNVSMMVGSAKVTDGLLNLYLQSWFVPGNLTSGMFLRGFPSKTINGLIDLETIAERIQGDASLCELIRTTSVRRLLKVLRQEPGAASVCADIHAYLEQYGHQIYNLDFAEPTLGEDPSAVVSSLRALVSRRNFDTPARQAELIRERDALIQQTASVLGPLRRMLFRKLLGWAQAYGPCREESLFYMGAAWSTLRRLALALGQRLADTGIVNRADDVFFVEWAELVELDAVEDIDLTRVDLKRIVAQRRALREARKRLHPPGIIPVGARWKFGPIDMTALETQRRNADDVDTLIGFAVSPGKVTGEATVILSPADFEQMRPETILVCPTTTPAWTPLFAQASGLVTDIGGILAHGSIVAREYGIPAVLGTGNGSQRIVTGQRITVDGDAGTVRVFP